MDWEKLLADCVDFTQRLIQTPSMSFEEDALAQIKLPMKCVLWGLMRCGWMRLGT